MANTLVTPVGRINNTSSTPLALGTAYDTKYATYLKLFSGEMFKAYEGATIAKGTVQSRTLKNGKAMQFIFTGRMEAAYHEPGTPILGSGEKMRKPGSAGAPTAKQFKQAAKTAKKK